MPATYEPIATTTLGSAASTITFSSIPATYTDLRIVYTGSVTVDGVLRTYFNNDTGANYSTTRLVGDGSAASSTRFTSTNDAVISRGLGTGMCLVTTDIFSYAGSTNKTLLSQASEDKNGSGFTASFVNLWRSTSAINRVDFYVFGSTFASGTTVTLYGIKNA
jgi:hypothetical protein